MLLFGGVILTCLYVLSCLINRCTCDTYKTYNLESDKICPQSKRLILKPVSTGLDGIIIKENSYFDDLSGKYDFKCRFEVETGHPGSLRGMFVVIQKLQLRKHPKTGECIDYIRFRPSERDLLSKISQFNFNLKSSKLSWVTFCGDIIAVRDGDKPSSEKDLSVAGFLSENSDVVEVEIYINKVPTFNQSLQLEVAFTPYMSCKNDWSEYKECGMNKCIKKRNFNDGVVNCPFLNCPDEDGCDIGIIQDDLPGDLPTKVTLTAVTSIFCSFFLFLGCIWCCRYFEVLCWSANNLLGRTNPVELSPIRQPSPSAPPPPESPHNKDLPPSYEALFPDRVFEKRPRYIKHKHAFQFNSFHN